MSKLNSWLGIVFKQYNDDAGHFKFYIIVAEKDGEFAALYINTEKRYKNLPGLLQASQFPVTPNDCRHLKHDSFADCSTIVPFRKVEINEYLQKNKGHHCGILPKYPLDKIMSILNKSKTIEKLTKEKYGFR